MANILLITDGENHEWYNWLSKELIKRGNSIFQPPLPKTKTIKAWMEDIKDYRKHLDENSMIIGHGAGRVILLKILEEKLRAVKGAHLISGKPLNEEFKEFNIKELDTEHIKNKTKNFFVYASEKDDEKSLKESENIAEILEEEVLILDNNKHFKNDKKFEDLLIDILSLTH